MRILRICCLLAGTLISLSSRLSAQSDTERFLPGIVYVKTAYFASDIDTSAIGMTALRSLCHKHHITDFHRPCTGLSATLNHLYVFKLGDIQACDTFIQELKQLAYIEFAERAPLFHITYTPNDYSPTNQYALELIDAPRAWDFTHGSRKVVLAIVDNAERITHEDIAPNLWVNTKEVPNNGLDDDADGYVDDYNGYDVGDNDNVPNVPAGITDTSSWIHGSHTSGIAGAATDNGKGIASIGFNVSIMAVKCTPSSESGNSLPDAFEGVVYAMRAGAKIISMSFGTYENSQAVDLLMQQAHNMGIVLVAAAGNDNKDSMMYPAAYPEVIAVAATDKNDLKAGFSNYGRWVDVCAPGVGIRSALGGTNSSYGVLSGTSMATPMVAGLAGLVLSAYPNASPDQVLSYIQKGCVNIDPLNPAYIGKLGAGRINAARTFGLSAIEAQQHSNEAFALYPNPIRRSDDIHIAINSLLNPQQAMAQVFNAQGLCVLRARLIPEASGFYTIPTAGLSPGTYWLRITDSGQSCSKALVVE